ncbi:MAG TPA: pitrilysin family protein, partial [Tenuifilaceae bacterium]|nr:pitrilysin family protein [Tenuifilaceae bacterium]
YDEPLDRAGGENNAFTTNDITNYYLSLPKENIETGFWLESDRMLSLAFSQGNLGVQKSVVVEEFNQSYLNQPYGDAWLLLRPLAYKVHPYMWSTIGKEPQHIKDATLNDVKSFFFSHYAPNNAILCVSGNIEVDEVKRLAEKWFAPIPEREVKLRSLPKEPVQTEPRTLEVTRNVPYDSIYMAFHMCNRNHPDYPATDLITDLLSNGKSSRLFQNLVKERKLFSDINAFITGDVDDGLLVVTGRLVQDISFEEAQNEIFGELNRLKNEKVSEYELSKVVNKFESTFTFGLTSPLEKAFNLCYYEMLGDAGWLNSIVGQYRNVTIDDITRVAGSIFTPDNCSTLLYKAAR